MTIVFLFCFVAFNETEYIPIVFTTNANIITSIFFFFIILFSATFLLTYLDLLNLYEKTREYDHDRVQIYVRKYRKASPSRVYTNKNSIKNFIFFIFSSFFFIFSFLLFLLKRERKKEKYI